MGAYPREGGRPHPAAGAEGGRPYADRVPPHEPDEHSLPRRTGCREHSDREGTLAKQGACSRSSAAATMVVPGPAPAGSGQRIVTTVAPGSVFAVTSSTSPCSTASATSGSP